MDTKPHDCTCEYPAVRVRNMCGHPESCRYYARWKAEFDAATAQRVVPQGGSSTTPPKFAKPTSDQLQNRYSYQAPKLDQATRYEEIRNRCLDLADHIVRLSPCSPEQARALNALDEVMMLANAAIARNE
jgi:hypothetical protein